MSTDVITLEVANATVRVVTTAGRPWFVAADICHVFGIPSTLAAVETLKDAQKASRRIDTPDRRVQATIISESGVLVLARRAGKTDWLRQWLRDAVLPAVRRTLNGRVSYCEERVDRLELLQYLGPTHVDDYAAALRSLGAARTELAGARGAGWAEW